MTEWEKGETFKFGNVTVTNYRPVLSEFERKKREEQVRRTMVHVMREYIHKKESPHDKPINDDD